jgi:insertion element IS1 protein InsB
VKTGKERIGKQRYVCKVCKKRQEATFDYNEYNPSLNKNIIALTKEGLCILVTE